MLRDLAHRVIVSRMPVLKISILRCNGVWIALFLKTMSEVRTTKLANGLRVVTDSSPHVYSVAMGAWIGVGTRNEELAHNGVAHMVEHMMFKGTHKRNALDIVEVIENVGGQVNAYTSREVTSYHVHLLEQDLPLALDVMADIVQNSTMPEDEVERERHVILQEIGMCNDTPDDVVFDHFAETAFPAQALGAPILGQPDIIGSMQRETLMNYVDRYYTPDNIVISAAGHVDHDRFVQQVEEAFAALKPAGGQTAYKQADYRGGEFREDKTLEQSHLILGFQGVPRLHKDYYTAQVLSTLLGGGMSSRLFQEVREKRGLVYSIFSFHQGFRDDGQFGVYAGTGPADLPELVPVVCQELMAVTQSVSEEELARAKAQMKSALLMGRESMMTRADQAAKYLIFHDDVLDIDRLLARIDAVDRDAVSRVAQGIFTSTPTIAALGPLAKLESYDAIRGRMAA